jgi:hypothetical protein
MKQNTYRIENGIVVKEKRNLKKKLNYNHLKLTNKTLCCGELDLPEIQCELAEMPDYIALYRQPSEYHKTNRTAVCFYDYDNEMDGQNGLYNAIKYDNKKDLEKYKERFSGIKVFFMPDYSVFGDIQAYENHHRIGRAREVALWLTMENDSIVIPNIAAGSIKDFEYIFDGYEKVKVAGISTKSKLPKREDRKLLQATIDEAVIRMPALETFVVYDISAENIDANILFSGAKEKGINIVIPDNSMKIRNRILKVRRDSK